MRRRFCVCFFEDAFMAGIAIETAHATSAEGLDDIRVHFNAPRKECERYRARCRSRHPRVHILTRPRGL